MSDETDKALERYADGRRTYVEDYAALRQGIRLWQLVALVSIAIGAVSVTGLVVVASKHKVVPYVVELDAEQQIVRTYPAEPLLPTNAQHTRATLGRWIQAWRNVSPDTHVIEDRARFVFALIQGNTPAQGLVYDWLNDNNPYDRAQSETASVEIISVTNRGGNSWQIGWRETSYGRQGHVIDNKRYTANVLVTFGQPKQESILLNPGGLYITEIDWQEVWVE